MSGAPNLIPEAQRQIFAQSPIGFVLLDAEQRKPSEISIHYANPAFYLLTGKAHGPRRKHISDYFPQTVSDKVLASLNGDKAQDAIDIKITGNRWLKLFIKSFPIGDETHPVIWVTDVTDSKKAVRKLEREVAQAEDVASMKSNFLATMSHEIRTPMQTIYGMLELMGEESPSPRLAEMIQTAKGSASGMLEILDDILDLAKVDAGKMELDDFEMPLRTLVYGLLEALEVKKLENHLYLKAEIARDIPFVVRGDPKRLRQVLMNLIGNGLKFTHEGGITVRVNQDLKHLTPPKGALGLRFEIIDTGIGMSGETSAKLFHAFTQADNSTTRKYGGTGLGLSISQKLVELMGGKIGVDSVEGEGSTFWFEIPTREVTGDNEVELPNLDGLAVLSVEDHPKGAQEIASSLRSMGAEVVSVPELGRGLELINSRPFDVAVIDHGLPDGWGTDLMKKIAEIRPFCGLILYTVHDDYGVQQVCKFLGAQHLQKPASRYGLGMAVKNAAKQIEKASFDGPKRLLVCDDNESVRDIIRRQLEVIGVEADFAFDGKEGLEIIGRGEHGLVISDLHMPEIDGYGLVKAVREKEARQNGGMRQPVVAMTADVQLVHSQEYLKHGFDECLLKPVSIGQLRRLLIRWGLIAEASRSLTYDQPQQDDSGLDVGDAPVNKAAVIAQMGAYDDSTLSMVKMFADMAAEQVDALAAAQAKQDAHKIADIAHSLKGGARSAGCLILGDLAAEAQKKAEKGTCDAVLVTQIRSEHVRLLSFLGREGMSGCS